MANAADILAFVEQLAPAYMKMDWDNVGLLCGRRSQEVDTVLVALDPFLDTAQEAAQVGAQLLLTHHPLIFRPVKAITDDTPVGQTILYLIEHGIAAINAHTNLDCAPGGVNDCLAEKLGLSQVQVIDPAGTDGDGRPWGLLRCGVVEEQELSDFLPRVKEALGCDGLRYVSGSKKVHRVAVGGGACAGELEQVIAAGCDTFVTADSKYNQLWDAYDLGVNLIDAGHFHTEQPVCAMLAEKLQAAFPEIRVVLSKNHKDCAEFF